MKVDQRKDGQMNTQSRNKAAMAYTPLLLMMMMMMMTSFKFTVTK
jgi:hypothetical protein